MTNPGLPLNVNWNVNIDSPPVTKLIETIGGGLGKFYEPFGKVLNAKAEAADLKIKTKGEVDAAIIKLEGIEKIQELAERASIRANFQVLRRQMNLDAIIEKAVYQLPDNVNDDKVELDWTVQWANRSQDTSNDEIQKLWAKILAGEVAKPGTFSLRTLDNLSLLSVEEARKFSIIGNYLWKFTENVRLCYFQGSSELNRRHSSLEIQQNVRFEEECIDEMVNIGLFQTIISHELLTDDQISLVYGAKFVQIINEGRHPRKLSLFRLSSVGEEMFSLLTPEPDVDYYKSQLEEWRHEGLTIVETDNVFGV